MRMDPIDDLRAELMAVEPSARFAADVRARIAADRSPRTVLQFSSAALSIAAVWALFAAGVPPQTTRTSSSLPVVQETASTALPTPVAAATVARRAARPAATGRRPAPAATVAVAEPLFGVEVLVPPDQGIAVQRLLQWHAAGRQHRLARDGHAVNWLTGALMQQRPLEIPLVTIEPLPGAEPGVGGKLK